LTVGGGELISNLEKIGDTKSKKPSHHHHEPEPRHGAASGADLKLNNDDSLKQV